MRISVTASLGASIPKSRASAEAVTSPQRTISSVVSAATASASARFRGDDANQDGVFFYTTQGTTLISGNEPWERYSVEMIETIPEEVTKIYVFLVLLNNTKGEVYFDDISLKVF